MAPPKYVQRIARLPEVFDMLAAHPDGVALATLAERVGVPADELREDLLAFYAADVEPLFLGLSRPSVLEFFGPDGEDVDPGSAEIVRINEEKPPEELGVEYVSASELALIYTAATALLDIEHDPHLASAVEVLTETMFGEVQPQPAEHPWNRQLEPLRTAIAERRKVRIVYSRSWAAGVIEPTIDPYLLVLTRRGWEIDAGPPDADGAIRTYLLSNVRSVEVLDERFELPSELDARLAVQRVTETVRVRIPQEARWAADFYAETVTLVEDDETSATLDLELLPPLGERVGRLLLACGPEAAVISPSALVAEAAELAAQLLAHHRHDLR